MFIHCSHHISVDMYVYTLYSLHLHKLLISDSPDLKTLTHDETVQMKQEHDQEILEAIEKATLKFEEARIVNLQFLKKTSEHSFD